MDDEACACPLRNGLLVFVIHTAVNDALDEDSDCAHLCGSVGLNQTTRRLSQGDDATEKREHVKIVTRRHRQLGHHPLGWLFCSFMTR